MDRAQPLIHLAQGRSRARSPAATTFPRTYELELKQRLCLAAFK